MSDDQVKQRTIQVKGRVDVPNDMWKKLGLKQGDDILVNTDGNTVIIRPATADQLK